MIQVSLSDNLCLRKSKNLYNRKVVYIQEFNDAMKRCVGKYQDAGSEDLSACSLISVSICEIQEQHCWKAVYMRWKKQYCHNSNCYYAWQKISLGCLGKGEKRVSYLFYLLKQKQLCMYGKYLQGTHKVVFVFFFSFPFTWAFQTLHHLHV